MRSLAAPAAAAAGEAQGVAAAKQAYKDASGWKGRTGCGCTLLGKMVS